MPNHGRRSDVLVSDVGSPAEQQVFRLQLKPSNHPDFQPSLQSVSSEYATRYLEQLGVSPATRTMELVHKNVPLTHKSVTTTLRVKGHVSDELQLSVPTVQHIFRVPKVIQPHPVLQLGLTNQEVQQAAQHTQHVGATEIPASGQAANSPPARIPGFMPDPDTVEPGSLFQHMASRFLHPFNLESNLTQNRLEELTVDLKPTEAERAQMVHAAWKNRESISLQHQTSLSQTICQVVAGARTPPGTSPRKLRSSSSSPRKSSRSLGGKGSESTALYGSATGDASARSGVSANSRRSSLLPLDRTSAWDPELLRMEVMEELLQEVVVTPDVVLALFSQIEAALLDWFTHQAPETLKGRLTKEELQATLELLTDKQQVCFIITLLHFMHQEFVKGSPSFPRHLEAKVQMQRSKTLRQKDMPSTKPSVPLSRSSSAKLGNMPSAASVMTNASRSMHPAVSRISALDKYDLGYKQWLQERTVSQQKQEQQDKAQRDKVSVAAHSLRTASRLDMLHSLDSYPSASHSVSRAHSIMVSHEGTMAGSMHVDFTSAKSPRKSACVSFIPPQRPSSSGNGQRHVSMSTTITAADAPPSPPPGVQRNSVGGASHVSPTTPFACIQQQDQIVAAIPGTLTPIGAEHGPVHSSTQHQDHSQRRGRGAAMLAGRRSEVKGKNLTFKLASQHSAVSTAGDHSTLQSMVSSGALTEHHHGSVAHPPPPVSLEEATKRSMINLHCTRALQAAMADGVTGPSHLTPADEDQLQTARLFVLLREFSALYFSLRQSRSGMFFTLPVYLLTCRLLISMLFNGLYRLWSRTQEGHEALLKMDAALVHLFDPHGYLQRNLSLIQSSPSAVSIMHKYPHKSHGANRLHFSDISPLMRAVMADAVSPDTRRLLQQAAAHKRKLGRSKHPKHVQAATATRLGNASSDRDGAVGPVTAEADGGDVMDYGDTLLGGWSVEDVNGPLRTRLNSSQKDILFREVQNIMLHSGRL